MDFLSYLWAKEKLGILSLDAGRLVPACVDLFRARLFSSYLGSYKDSGAPTLQVWVVGAIARKLGEGTV